MEYILGQKVYPTIADIPDDNVDLFLFALPQEAIKSSLEKAIKKGCKAAVIFSAGFKEAGDEGARLQEEIKQLANAAGVKIVGPNTLGFLRADTKINATFEPQYSDLFEHKGKIALLMQSGGVGVIALNQMMEQGIPLGTFIALGNRMNLEFYDMLEFFENDDETAVVCMHVEGTEDVRKLYEAAARCAKKKPVIVLGGGYTEAGGKGAKSHTGTMASSSAIYRAAYQQAGVLQVSSVNEMINAAKMLLLSPEPKGRDICVLTHLAGPSVLCCDKLELGGLSLAELNDTTKAALSCKENKILPDFVPADNPVDLAAYGKTDPARFVRALAVLVKDAGVGGVISISASALKDEYAAQFPVEEYGQIIAQSKVPSAVVWGAYYTDYHHEFKRFYDAGIPAYPTPEEAGEAFANYVKYYTLRDRNQGSQTAPDFDLALDEFLASQLALGSDFLQEHESKLVMEYAGIDVAKTVLAANRDKAVVAADKIGYPVVLKVAADNIIHKSDMGGVKLNLACAAEVQAAYDEIEANAQKIPNAGFKGVAVEKMLPPGGQELIIGALRDPQAGPVVMVGLGGIYVEVLKDTAFRLAPVTKNEAQEMPGELKGRALLQGVRGSKPVDEDTLAELIVKVSHLISMEAIKEIDLNPVICYGGAQYCVADARVILNNQ